MPESIIPEVIAINVDAMSPHDSQLLFTFLKQQIKDPMNKLWRANHAYDVPSQSGLVTFTINHKIIRGRKNKPTGCIPCAVMEDQHFAKGAFAKIYDVKTLLICKDSLQSSNQARVIKVQKHDKKEHPASNAIREYRRMKTAGHLGVKYPTFIKIGHYKKSFMVMNKMPGQEIFAHMLNERITRQYFNHTFRLKLSLALLQAVQRQVVSKGLVHGDLANTNVLVDLTSNDIVINVIDFGIVPKPENDIARLGQLLNTLWDTDFLCSLDATIKTPLLQFIATMMAVATTDQQSSCTIETAIATFAILLTKIQAANSADVTHADKELPVLKQETTPPYSGKKRKSSLDSELDFFAAKQAFFAQEGIRDISRENTNDPSSVMDNPWGLSILIPGRDV